MKPRLMSASTSPLSNAALLPVTQRIHQDEAKLLSVKDDEEREKLVGEIGDLHIRQKELMDALSGEVD